MQASNVRSSPAGPKLLYAVFTVHPLQTKALHFSRNSRCPQANHAFWAHTFLILTFSVISAAVGFPYASMSAATD